MFGAGPADADVVRFLKRVVADERGRNLTGESDQRHGVHESVRQSGHDIGHAGTGSYQHHSRFASGLGISFSHMGGALFMTGQDNFDVLLLVQNVENLKHDSPGDAEDDFNVLLLERFDEYLRSGLLHFASPWAPPCRYRSKICMILSFPKSLSF